MKDRSTAATAAQNTRRMAGESQDVGPVTRQPTTTTTNAAPVRELVAPNPRSKTRRRNNATHARQALLRYTGALDLDDADQGSQGRMQALLWAQAHIAHAIAEETRGRWGSTAATPRRIAEAYKAAENGE